MNISKESLEILLALYRGEEIDPRSVRYECLRQLKNEELISTSVSGFESGPDGRFKAVYSDIKITESGRSYVQQSEDNELSMRVRIDTLSSVADSLSQQLDMYRRELENQDRQLAMYREQINVQRDQLSAHEKQLAMYREQIDSAKHDSFWSSVRSWIAIAISVVSIYLTLR